jgi:hypothetical protein
MNLKLIFPRSNRQHVLLAPGSFLLGSDPASEVVVEGEGIQPMHCELIVGSNGVQLRVPPARKVWVNERSVDGMIALRAGDGIRCGSELIRLVDVASPLVGGFTPIRHGDVDIGATMVRPVVPKFVLRGMSGEHFGRSFPLNASLTVGRAEDATLQLPLDGISRQHARLTPAGDEVLLEDLGSANGTWLNGKRITRTQAQHGDEISFDTQRFQLIVPGQALKTTAVATTRKAQASMWWIVLVILVVAGIAFALLR